MSIYVSYPQVRAESGKPQGGVTLINHRHGAVAGCCSGVTLSSKTTFGSGDVHPDQEGFLVLRGQGEALVGDQKISLTPGVALMVPAGVSHTMRCVPGSDCYEAFWFHASVTPNSLPRENVVYHTSIQEKTGKAMDSCVLLGEENGCVNGCVAGITLYTDLEYTHSGVHEDQEGFYVLEGTGFAKVGDVEFPVAPGTAFLAPAHTWHSVRRDESCPHVAVFWFHSGV